MPTVEERYTAATRYVREAVASVESHAIGYAINPATGEAEWYAGRLKAQPAREELARITAHWLRATTDEERERIARDVEALAIRVIETMPLKGCVRDAGLVDVQTPGSIKAELETVAGIVHQLDRDITDSQVDASFKSAWRAFADEWEKFHKEHSGWFDRWWYSAYEKAVEFRRRALTWREKFIALGGAPSGPTDKPPTTASEQVDRLINVALLGGGLYAGYKLVSALLRHREVGQKREASAVRRALNTQLSRVASRRDARPRTARHPRPPRLRLDDTDLDSWFERDRGYIGLRDRQTGQMIVEWWDDDLRQAIEDGFLPSFSRWSHDAAHRAAYEYAKHVGLVAEPRDAGGGRHRPHTYAIQLKQGEIEALQFLRGRYASAKAFYDGLVPLDSDADQSLSGEFVRRQGPYRFHIRASDVRKALRATVGDGGDYGAIPNLRSDAVDWVLAEEWRRTP